MYCIELIMCVFEPYILYFIGTVPVYDLYGHHVLKACKSRFMNMNQAEIIHMKSYISNTIFVLVPHKTTWRYKRIERSWSSHLDLF